MLAGVQCAAAVGPSYAIGVFTMQGALPPLHVGGEAL
jgi:hypothetical protein